MNKWKIHHRFLGKLIFQIDPIQERVKGPSRFINLKSARCLPFRLEWENCPNAMDLLNPRGLWSQKYQSYNMTLTLRSIHRCPSSKWGAALLRVLPPHLQVAVATSFARARSASMPTMKGRQVTRRLKLPSGVAFERPFWVDKDVCSRRELLIL